MNYYKVVANGNVIDANFIFLKWQEKHGIIIGCDAAEAQFIQSSDQAKVWRTPWLHPAPEAAGTYETVEAIEITEEEYSAIREQLDDGQTVTEPEPEEPQPTEPDEGDDTGGGSGETVMSTAEMRRIITEQANTLQEQAERLEFLEGCLLEMSEVVYDA
jgi:hypothetical protein